MQKLTINSTYTLNNGVKIPIIGLGTYQASNIKIIRVGNEVVEVLMDNFEKNLPKLIQFMMESGLKINAMSRDIASFRRYFQLRIQEEEEKERSLQTQEDAFKEVEI